MEIEALIAIFMDDFKIITDKPPRAYELSVWPSSDRFVLPTHLYAWYFCIPVAPIHPRPEEVDKSILWSQRGESHWCAARRHHPEIIPRGRTDHCSAVTQGADDRSANDSANDGRHHGMVFSSRFCFLFAGPRALMFTPSLAPRIPFADCRASRNDDDVQY